VNLENLNRFSLSKNAYLSSEEVVWPFEAYKVVLPSETSSEFLLTLLLKREAEKLSLTRTNKLDSEEAENKLDRL
jgi:hypothetical protein